MRGGTTGSHGYFLTVMFPHHQMTILDYNRVVRDLNGRSVEQLLAALRERFTVTASDRPVRPAASGEFGMFLAGRWYRLTLDPKLVPQNDPIGRLPVTLLRATCSSRCSASPTSAPTSASTSSAAAAASKGLKKRVASGEMAAAFALYPTQMTDLMAVADAGLIMPPKSTWFEPKLADGMVSHVLD